MREAIGSAFIVNLILIFIGVISALLIGSINYSKAYKVKDRIIYIIEKYDGYNSTAQEEIDKSLASIGYTVIDGFSSKCEGIYKRRYGSSYDPSKLLHGKNVGKGQYDYCVYENYYEGDSEKNSNTQYYSVISFMRFDVPLIGNMLVFPVSGETASVISIVHD